MAVNTELAAQVYSHITLHPEQHDQGLVVEGYSQLPNGNICGTIGCIAGWTCAYAGKLMEYNSISNPGDPWVAPVDWFEDARIALGISDHLASALFDSEIPEEDARHALGLLALGGGSEDGAESYLRTLGYV